MFGENKYIFLCVRGKNVREKLDDKVLFHPMLTNEKSFIGDDIARKFITII